MKLGSVLINASRGLVVRIEALATPLKSKKLLGAAIDVFPVGPRSNKDLFESPLRGIDNVILTPHVGGSTMEALFSSFPYWGKEPYGCISPSPKVS